MSRGFVDDAIKFELTDRNPFNVIKTGSYKNASRSFFVDRETINKALEACTDPMLNLIIRLSGFGGLRTPSEPRNVELSDINWNAKTIRIKKQKQKTSERPIPLFPDALRIWDGSKIEQAKYTGNFTTLLKSIDVKPWPRLWHNMRASRQTELADRFPTHVVCKWIGNSEKVASYHYLQITDDMLAEAVRDPKRDHPSLQLTTRSTKPATRKLKTRLYVVRNRGR